MESLWPNFEELPVEENRSIQILRDQARAIQSSTNNVIRATFSKMSYNSGAMVAVERLGQIMLSMSSGTYEEILEEELQGKSDANELFSITKYKFEIFNDEYRFRLFILNYSELFPISLEVDGGILGEISYKNKEHINSNSELIDILKDIFSCEKVRIVVARMRQKK